MSRIFEAIQTAKESRSKGGVAKSDSLGEMEMPDRRVAPRADLDINLTVYGRGAGDSVFYEQAKAISGNANGGVFLLGIPVTEGQDLLLINDGTSAEQVCTVVSVRIRDMQTSEVSVSFASPNAKFWLCFRKARRG